MKPAGQALVLVAAFAAAIVAVDAGALDRLVGKPEDLRDCRAIDGDTLVCGREHIRLTAIDAPELAGHCRAGRACAPGDPIASMAGLALYVGLSKRLTIERIETDHYGRTVGDVFADGISLSCVQLASSNAIYWPRYDRGGRIKRECKL